MNATGIGGGAAGIGRGYSGDDWEVIISGGIVYALGGHGPKSNVAVSIDGTFSTGENGNAIIYSATIGDQSHKNDWSGIIFEGSVGKVYGDMVAPTVDCEVSRGYSLTIPEGTTLEIAENVTLTNNGTINNLGTLLVNGTLIGTVNGDVRYPSSVSVDISGTEVTGGNTVPYGSSITITAVLTSGNVLAGMDKVDFYLGEISLGSTNIQQSGDSYIAKWDLTISGEKWKPNSVPYTITADFGSATGEIRITVVKGKQFGPDAPTVAVRKSTEITLNGFSTGGIGAVEYGFVQGNIGAPNNWQSSPVFTGLRPGTIYTFYSRYTGNEYFNPAISDTGTKISTLSTSGTNIVVEGETVILDDGTQITNEGDKATINKDGVITIITPAPEGGVIVDQNGNITLPGGSIVQAGNGEETTIPPGGGIMRPDGTVSYQVTVRFESQGGSGVANQTITVGNVIVKPEDPIREGNRFLGWYTEKDGGRKWDFSQPVMMEMTLYAQWQNISEEGTNSENKITIVEAEYGTVTTNKSAAQPGDIIIITAIPDKDYKLDEISVISGENVVLNKINETQYTFEMPANDVYVNVTFVIIDNNPEGPEPEQPPKPEMPFTDVTEANWYYDEVYYVWANGLMQGTSATTFGPNVDTTRAMVVTILWRLEGEPASGYDMDYSDVAGGAWYAGAVRWATEHGIVNGSEGQFYPGGTVTREQLAAMLYRYAQYKNYDLTADGDLSGFADANAVSGWAETSLEWAVGQGMLQGSDRQVDPQGFAIRAQLAAILKRFMENVAQ